MCTSTRFVLFYQVIQVASLSDQTLEVTAEEIQRLEGNENWGCRKLADWPVVKVLTLYVSWCLQGIGSLIQLFAVSYSQRNVIWCPNYSHLLKKNIFSDTQFQRFWCLNILLPFFQKIFLMSCAYTQVTEVSGKRLESWENISAPIGFVAVRGHT